MVKKEKLYCRSHKISDKVRKGGHAIHTLAEKLKNKARKVKTTMSKVERIHGYYLAEIQEVVGEIMVSGARTRE